MSIGEDRAEVTAPPNPYTSVLQSLDESCGRLDKVQNQIIIVDDRLHGSSARVEPSADKVAKEPNGYMETLQCLTERLQQLTCLAEDNIDSLVRKVDL